MYEIILAVIVVVLTIIIFYFYKTPLKCTSTTKNVLLLMKFQLITINNYQAVTWKNGILAYETIQQTTPLYLSSNGLIYDCTKLQPLTTKTHVTSGEKTIHIGQTYEYNNLLMWKIDDKGYMIITVAGTNFNVIATSAKLGFYTDPPSQFILMPLNFFPPPK
ncbi:pI177L [African swine fever virus]|uniref:BA71V-I177L (K14L) n=1 Tax=African swine fever virus TaxID=10497 RepID=A0A0C5BCW3_ASF|nr:BA71V-I177L (k14L) [African swine fever virus]UYB79295.1 pI177L [Recombinant African swine fever virus]AJL34318.1 BA71V-I177L (k14L) [African swine fever virus]AXB49370.1 pI177L [African swine fever virus]AXB49544.1 pI177L [African swine fever virus]AXB49716.1 pI177L [African swine fever virus]